METNDDITTQNDNNNEVAQPAIIRIILLFLGAAFAFLATLNSLFHFGPPFIFGIAAGLCFLAGTQLFKR